MKKIVSIALSMILAIGVLAPMGDVFAIDATNSAMASYDVDGDGDDNESEFAKSLPIRFSVTVSAWETAENNTNITIK